MKFAVADALAWVLVAAVCPNRGIDASKSSVIQSSLTAPLLSVSQKTNEGEANMCNTPGCVMAAANLLRNIDASVDPCENFYNYACGKFKENYPIPDDKSREMSFSLAEDQIELEMRSLLESTTPPSIGKAKVIDITRQYFKLCMDTDTQAQLKSEPVIAALNKVGGWPAIGGSQPKKDFDLSALLIAMRNNMFLLLEMCFLEPAAMGPEQFWIRTGSQGYINPLFWNPRSQWIFCTDFVVDAFWNSDVQQDDKNVTRQMLFFDQTTLSLPREYYLNDTEYGSIISAYKEYVADIATLLVEDSNLTETIDLKTLKADASEMVEFEKQIAALTSKEEDRRDPVKLYNLWTIADLKDTLTFVNWDKYFDAIMPKEVRATISNKTEIVVNEPKYLKDITELIHKTDKRTLVNYAVGMLAVYLSSHLDERYRDVSQKFTKVLSGREAKPVVWKRCVARTLDHYPKAAGALYVDRSFNEQQKEEALAMIKHLRAALSQMIKDVKWMDEQTRSYALVKLENIAAAIGYPDYVRNAEKLDDYYKDLLPLVTDDDSYFELFLKTTLGADIKQFKKLLKPSERFEFIGSPATVNAFYLPSRNIIQFPAGILRPPFFHGDYPKVINFGAIGAIIGHEFTHGFDDEGSQYDEWGNLKNWWSEKSRSDFVNRTGCIVAQYSSYALDVQGAKRNVNGRLTQGENIADNGGLKESFTAYQRLIQEQGEAEPLLPGLNKTNEQVFFLAFASNWCTNQKDASLLEQMLGDPHSPSEFRTNGPISNSDEFAKAFNCPAGSPMNPVKTPKTKCEVW